MSKIFVFRVINEIKFINLKNEVIISKIIAQYLIKSCLKFFVFYLEIL